ncbi:MAG: YmdB family metallophosphoesterase [Candidatus Melainabacteria bacterium]|jgi:metallophosphoesterase (TIGR00282 family)
MNILFFGDIFGNKALDETIHFIQTTDEGKLAEIKIANVENAAEGFGITEAQYNKLIKAGFDMLSGGNHIWDKKEIFHFITKSKIARPCNLPSGTPGSGWQLINKNINNSAHPLKIGLINVLGRVFMNITALECPFRACDKAIEELKNQGADLIIVDIHAETTSEKNALAHYLDGRVSAIVGTHTHIPTADERILPKGTAYITDIGACASQESVIGMSTESILPKFLTGLPSRGEVSKKPIKLNAVNISFDLSQPSSGILKANRIKRISQYEGKLII